MKIDKKPIESINEIANLLPIEILEDVQKRMQDWCLSGGKEDDPYMFQQLQFAQAVVKRLEELEK